VSLFEKILTSRSYPVKDHNVNNINFASKESIIPVLIKVVYFMPWKRIRRMWLSWLWIIPQRKGKGCPKKYSQSVALLNEQQKDSQSGVSCKEHQRKWTPKTKIHTKKRENANVVRKITNAVSSEKGTAETLKCCSFSQRISKNTQVLFLFTKEQQKHASAVPFWKWTAKSHKCSKVTQVLFLFAKEQQKYANTVPLEKEQQNHTNAVPFWKGTAKPYKCCKVTQALFLFWKGTAKTRKRCSFLKRNSKITQMLFLFEKEQHKHASVVPFWKGTAKSHYCCSFCKRNRKNTHCCSFWKKGTAKTQTVVPFEKGTAKTRTAVPFEKGTAKTRTVVPFEKKEQQKHTKCCSFWKRNSKNTPNVKVQKRCSISKRNSSCSISKRNSKIHNHKMQTRKEWISCSPHWCFWMKQHLKHKI